MRPIKIRCTIAASPQKVFNTVADIRQFAQAVPEVTGYEILSDIQSGKGTRFREKRNVKGREILNELEITEYIENERVRIETENNGTVWDSLFTVSTEGDKTQLTLQMEAHSLRWLPQVMNSVMRGMIRKSINSNMDSIKTYCQR